MPRLPALTLALALAAAPAAAHDGPDLRLPEKWGEALEDLLQDMGPALEEALRQMEAFGKNYDPRHYESPEILPNGDIIIRRREDAPEYQPGKPQEPEDTAPQDDETIKL